MEKRATRNFADLIAYNEKRKQYQATREELAGKILKALEGKTFNQINKRISTHIESVINADIPDKYHHIGVYIEKFHDWEPMEWTLKVYNGNYNHNTENPSDGYEERDETSFTVYFHSYEELLQKLQERTVGGNEEPSNYDKTISLLSNPQKVAKMEALTAELMDLVKEAGSYDNDDILRILFDKHSVYIK